MPRDNAVCQSCGTRQPMGSGVIVCRSCGGFGLQPTFTTEDEANEHAGDHPVAYVSDPVGDDSYWIVDVEADDG